MHSLTIFAERFPQTFHQHVERLQTDPHYCQGFQDAAQAISYQQWLRSDKWILTAKLARLLQPRCEDCGGCEQLQVHHKTYKHLGIEILYLSDLTVLCRECHAARHARRDYQDFVYLPGTTHNGQMRITFEPAPRHHNEHLR